MTGGTTKVVPLIALCKHEQLVEMPGRPPRWHPSHDGIDQARERHAHVMSSPVSSTQLRSTPPQPKRSFFSSSTSPARAAISIRSKQLGSSGERVGIVTEGIDGRSSSELANTTIIAGSASSSSPRVLTTQESTRLLSPLLALGSTTQERMVNDLDATAAPSSSVAASASASPSSREDSTTRQGMSGSSFGLESGGKERQRSKKAGSRERAKIKETFLEPPATMESNPTVQKRMEKERLRGVDGVSPANSSHPRSSDRHERERDLHSTPRASTRFLSPTTSSSSSSALKSAVAFGSSTGADQSHATKGMDEHDVGDNQAEQSTPTKNKDRQRSSGRRDGEGRVRSGSGRHQQEEKPVGRGSNGKVEWGVSHRATVRDVRANPTETPLSVCWIPIVQLLGCPRGSHREFVSTIEVTERLIERAAGQTGVPVFFCPETGESSWDPPVGKNL